MICVMGGTIYNRFQNVRDFTVSVVDTHGPEVDQNEKYDVEILVERKDERKEMVRKTLHKTVEWMEGVARKRRRHFKGVVWFVDGAIQQSVMKCAMNPVNHHISE